MNDIAIDKADQDFQKKIFFYIKKIMITKFFFGKFSEHVLIKNVKIPKTARFYTFPSNDESAKGTERSNDESAREIERSDDKTASEIDQKDKQIAELKVIYQNNSY